MPNEWQGVLDEVRKEVSEMAFGGYFKDLKYVSCENGILVISAPNVFVKQQIEGKYRPLLLEAARTAGLDCEDLEVRKDESRKRESVVRRAFEIRPDNEVRTVSTNFTPASALPRPSATPSVGGTTTYGGTTRFSTKDNGLNASYRLSNYVIGSNNDLAVSAAKAIIEHPGERYNPLFLYGGPGLGKTHLVQAIGNEILERYPDKRVLYVTTEQFYHDFVEAMRKKIQGFQEKYRDVDVLIVDDFQSIVGKDRSQEEFFHTFNELHQHNKQIIVTSDRLPTQLEKVDERLASRLTMGMPIDIQMPDFETRCAIIKAKAEALGKDIDNETVEFIAKNYSNNIRDMNGKLNQIFLLADLRNVSPREIIKDESVSTNDSFINKKRSIPPKKVIEKVAKYYGLSIDDLLGTSRVKDIKNARQIAMYLLNEELNLSTVQIGREFGKDHTTIMHGVKIVKGSLKTDFTLREQMTELREKIYA